MKIFDFTCAAHPDKIVAVESISLKEIKAEDKNCKECGLSMERYFGSSTPLIAYKGPNWPKRDIRERAHRLRKSDMLAKKQKKVWDPRMPKLNLDPDLQREAKARVARAGATMTLTKV